jgi:nicotinamidase-related amidase
MATRKKKTNLARSSKEFLGWLSNWHANLSALPINTVLSDPTRTAICTVDMLNGFCYEGTLASPRSAACIAPIVKLFQTAHARGVQNFVSIQEWHSEHAEEFNAYGAHCIAGTPEAKLVPDIAALDFSHEIQFVRKNSIHTVVGTTMETWLAQHPEINTFLVTGVCTDLCSYDLAMDLKLRANITDIPRRVIVPANCVNTYDLPVETAQKIGVLPHDGDLLHALFLYMMELNKIEIAKEIV